MMEHAYVSVGRRLKVIPLTLLVAVVLAISPLPDWAATWRPAWALLVTIYWCIAMPAYFGVASAWCTGLMLDVFNATLLGQNALGFTVAAYIAARYHLVIRNLSLVQQALTVGAMVMTFNLAMFAIESAAGYEVALGSLAASSVSSAIVWPWVFLVMRAVRRRWLGARAG